jgi:lipopolysaccharide/colanic/teichoic acid biosynthesis glycosyltransferase
MRRKACSGNPDGFEGCLRNPPQSDWIRSRKRRAVDIIFSALLLLLLFVPMLIIAACVRLTSKGAAIFSQNRVGLNGRLFRIYKFRSMVQEATQDSTSGLTKDGDDRVTPLGRVLRKLKLDELPQFYNVLRGDMSLVGPRPKLPQYAAIANMPYRPGITGPATLAFHHEEEILGRLDPGQVEEFYMEHIKPLKVRLDVCYMCTAHPVSDLHMIMSTTFPRMRGEESLLTLPNEYPSCGPQLLPPNQTVAKQTADTY